MVIVFEVIHEDTNLLGLKKSWTKTKIQSLRNLLNEMVQSVHTSGEIIKVF